MGDAVISVGQIFLFALLRALSRSALENDLPVENGTLTALLTDHTLLWVSSESGKTWFV